MTRRSLLATIPGVKDSIHPGNTLINDSRSRNFGINGLSRGRVRIAFEGDTSGCRRSLAADSIAQRREHSSLTSAQLGLNLPRHPQGQLA